MPLSQLAHRLLQIHAQRPRQIFYATDALGSMFRDPDLARLDEAYRELERAHLMQPAGATISFFGAPKNLYELTDKGTVSARESAA